MSLQPFTHVTGKAAPMLAANIDTDVIMPKQFLKGIDRSGLDRGLFFDCAGGGLIGTTGCALIVLNGRGLVGIGAALRLWPFNK